MRRPGGCLRLEKDRAVLRPQPRPPLVDLRHACASESRRDRSRADRCRSPARARAAQAGQSSSRSSARRRAQARVAGLGRLVEHVDGLAGPVDARAGKLPPAAASQSSETARSSPMIMRARPVRPRRGERRATVARRNDVRADVAEARPADRSRRSRDEPADRPPSRVLEIDALDGILGAEVEDLLDGAARRRAVPA